MHYCFAGVRASFCQRAHRLVHSQQQGPPRTAVVARITGRRDEYVIEGIQDPEDIWGEEAENEFIEVSTPAAQRRQSWPSSGQAGSTNSCQTP